MRLANPTRGRSFYSPQLDVVRFFAFLAVFCHHVLPREGTGNSFLHIFADAMGFGLCLFFVLSAYLITLLLMREQAKTGRIHFFAFYMRRILRIWPLYALGIGIGIFRALMHGVLQQQRPWFVAALLFSGNLIYPGAILMSHLWSISVEEQFYFLFPPACNFGRRGIFLFALVVMIVANIALVHFAHTNADLDVTVWFSSLVQFQMFAAGIVLALVDEHLPRWNTVGSLFATAFSFGIWLFVAGTFHLKTVGVLAQSASSICIAYALVALACCLLIVAIQGLGAPGPLVYSGKISYGLYVFHIPAIALITSHVRVDHGGALLSLLAAYGVAALSYRYYETPFLTLKGRFEVIATRTV